MTFSDISDKSKDPKENSSPSFHSNQVFGKIEQQTGNVSQHVGKVSQQIGNVSQHLFAVK